MKSDIRRASKKEILSHHTWAFDQLAVTVVAAQVTPFQSYANAKIGLFHPDDQVKLDWAHLSWGISDDPVDEVVGIGLRWASNFSSFLFSASAQDDWLYYTNTTWRSIGTDAGPIQTMNRDDVVWDEEDGFIGPQTERDRLELFARSNSASAMVCSGTINYDYLTVQTKIPDRKSDWQGWTFEEVIAHVNN